MKMKPKREQEEEQGDEMTTMQLTMEQPKAPFLVRKRILDCHENSECIEGRARSIVSTSEFSGFFEGSQHQQGIFFSSFDWLGIENDMQNYLYAKHTINCHGTCN